MADTVTTERWLSGTCQSFELNPKQNQVKIQRYLLSPLPSFSSFAAFTDASEIWWSKKKPTESVSKSKTQN